MPDNPQSGKNRHLQTLDPTMDKPQPVKPKNPLHHILRVDNEAKCIHCWQVSVMRQNSSTIKVFADKKNGGRDKALQAAIRYRDELLAGIDHLAHYKWLTRNNASGTPGIARLDVMANRNPDTRYVCWCARWTDEHGIRRQRGFSVARYGEQEAKRLAIAEREHQLERVCIAKGLHWYDPHIAKEKHQNHKPRLPKSHNSPAQIQMGERGTCSGKVEKHIS